LVVLYEIKKKPEIMKKLIVVLSLIFCFTNQSFSETSDSLQLTSKVKRNEIGISLRGMNNLTNSNWSMSDFITLSYKRKINDFALRFALYHYTKEKVESYNNLIKVNDSILILTYYKTKTDYLGAKIGIERDVKISNNLVFFYGIDVFYSNIKEEHFVSSVWYIYGNEIEKINGNADSFSNNPDNTSFGYEVGINPIAGITQYFSPVCSATLEFSFLSYYTKIKDTSRTTPLDERLKLTISFGF